jgi:hypothetical protein
MRSVADSLRRSYASSVPSTAAARVSLALALGDCDLDAFARFHGFDRPRAARLLERRRQVGRAVSRCKLASVE